MGAISIEGVEKWFGRTNVIKGLDLEMADGEFVVLVGPSGCGKTTTMRMVAGLEDVSRGRILIDGEDVTDRAPSERQLSMVFQSYALYPHMDVERNMGFGLRNLGVPRAEIDSKVAAAAKVLRLDGFLKRRPKELSGGQRQRVAIGRAIVREPKAFLFDEPLSNLDAALRVEMRFEIGRLHAQLGTTMVYVTHDQVEAMTLADKIVLMDQGQVIQAGTPRDLYERPANLFAAGFIGSPRMNFMPCAVDGARFTLPEQQGGAHGLTGDGTPTQLGIRPEHITIAGGDGGHCQGKVALVEYLGAESHVHVECAGVGLLVARLAEAEGIQAGDTVGLRFDERRLHFFGADGNSVS